MEMVSVTYPRRPKMVNVPLNVDDVVVLVNKLRVEFNPRHTMSSAGSVAPL
jgi:hypothetical protein